jgi:hypothetical protein
MVESTARNKMEKRDCQVDNERRRGGISVYLLVGLQPSQMDIARHQESTLCPSSIYSPTYEERGLNVDG